MNNNGIRSQLQLVRACRDVARRVPTVVVDVQCVKSLRLAVETDNLKFEI
jgi:hypothetical protein